MSEFRLPDVGEGLTEAEVLTWHVAVGDVVEVNQVIVDIETAKSVVELPSPFAGEVTALLVREGTTVPVGTPIIAIGGPTGAVVPDDPRDLTEERPVQDDTEDPAGEDTLRQAQEPREPVLVGYGVRTASTRRRRRKGDAEPVGSVAAPPAPSHETEPATGHDQAPAQRVEMRTLAKPPVRKLAKDHGVDLTTVPCDGPVVTRADVEAFIAGRRPETSAATTATSPAPPAPVRSAEGDTRIPVKGVRKATAQAMVSSAFTAPHVTEWVTLDVTATMELVERLKADRRFRASSTGSGQEVKVSPTLLVAKAVCLALARTPELNASWDEQAQEIVLKGSVNLGVAAATDRGLVVPNIPGADRMSLVELARALGDLTATARAGRTQPAQMSGGTFTITNVGVFGVDAGTPILNPGETGILCVGQIDRRPWVVGSPGGGVGGDERIEPRWVTTLAVSFDHRVVDGQQGSQFLADVAALLRDPALALTF